MTWLITLLPISCSLNDDCGDYELFEIYMEDFALISGFFNGANFYPQDLSIRPQSFESAAIVLEVIEESRVRISQSARQELLSWNTPLIACSPLEPEVINRITTLNITAEDTVYADSIAYPPYASLNSLFRLESKRCPNRSSCDINSVIDDVIDRQYGLFGSQGSELMFLLSEAPDSLINSTFHFEVKLDDGKEFDLSTGPLLIE
ncbi:MAG: hypothetical protein RIC80_13820 [Cyclobacteriaceae bacterium]